MSKKKIVILSVSVILSLILITTLLITFLYIIPNERKQKERKLAVLTYKQNKLNLYEQENALYDDYEVDVAFLGDSLTDGYDVVNFYPQLKVSNRGIGGDRTYDLLSRIQISAYDLKPKVITMLIGANNFKTMFNDYETIVKGLKENLPNTKIVLLSLTAMSGEWGKNNELACFNNIKIKLIADKYNCTFVDLFTPLFDISTNGIFPEFTTDGGHLTNKGYTAITNILTPVLENLL